MVSITLAKGLVTLAKFCAQKSHWYIVNSVAMNEALFKQKSLWIRENLNLFTNAKLHRFLPKRLDFACENLPNNCKCDRTLMLRV